MRGWGAAIPPHIKSAFKHAAGDGATIRDKTTYATGACGMVYGHHSKEQYMMIRTPKARKQNKAQGQYTYRRMLAVHVSASGQDMLNIGTLTPTSHMRRP